MAKKIKKLSVPTTGLPLNALNGRTPAMVIGNMRFEDHDILTPDQLDINSDGVNIQNDLFDSHLSVTKNAPGQFASFVDTAKEPIGVYTSDGSPENVVEANTGSVCTDVTNGVLYMKKTSNSMTGWVPVGGKSGSGVHVSYNNTRIRMAITQHMPQYTIPQITDGAEILRHTVTPHSITNKLLIKFNVCFAGKLDHDRLAFAIFQDGVTDALTAVGETYSTSSTVGTKGQQNTSGEWYMDAGTANPITFILRGGITDDNNQGDFLYINGNSDGAGFGGKMSTSITVFETIG